MVIGIMGTPMESSNLGCMALTYSMLIELEQIAQNNNLKFQYVIFDGSENEKAKKQICYAINIKPENLISGNMVMLYNPLRIMKNWNSYRKMMNEIEKCDCIIDITGGDSFSDIYGNVTFFGRTNAKIMVTKKNKPLLLAPQTYGPFQTPKSEKKAAEAISKADCVMTRDRVSQEVVKKLTGRNAICCADMAFLLPYHKGTDEKKEKVKVGINVSKLLYSDGDEVPERNLQIKTDYVKYTYRVLEELTHNESLNIFLIPHVGLDNEVHQLLKEIFPKVHIIKPLSNPIEMKSIISTMDIFIGARMHGTIAAFTAGVACIPVAYSRKFAGLFQNLDYQPLIDLQILDTKSAVSKTLEYVRDYAQLRYSISQCKGNVQMQTDILENEMSKWILKCAGKHIMVNGESPI